jgi:single-stranded-DNA-specific exonuclease
MAKAYSLRDSVPASLRERLSAYPEILQDFLYARGIDTSEKAEEFLNPSWEKHTHDPFLITGMEKAVERILAGMHKNERITIWSDYDCDGTPGGSILHDYFKKIGYKNFTNYIPHRYLEGYGLNIPAIEQLRDEGTTLMITVDCGIADVEPVKRAQELGIDVIVTDHHLTQDEIPPAFAVINSKQDQCEYPFDMLCGAAVAWKLGSALLRKGKFEHVPKDWEKWLLDLAGLSTIADMVPLNGENRVFAYYGLKVLQKTRRPGLLKLLRKMRIDPRNLTEDDIGFMIAPRINAASRMGDPRLAFELLTSTDEDGKAGALADELEKLNSARKGVVGSMVKEMKHTLSERKPIPSVIVMGNPSWRPGLLGLAANNIMEEHVRPVFLWGREGGDTLKGSCRSDGSVDVVRLMQAVPAGVFTEFGGHALSGGFAVDPDQVHYLEDHLLTAYGKTKQETAGEEVFVDKKISPDEIDWLLWNIVSKLAPFGIENPKPLFLLERQEVKNIKQFGKTKEHLEITFGKSNGELVKAIQFFNAHGSENIKTGEKISILAHLEKSFFGYKPELRLRIVDFV